MCICSFTEMGSPCSGPRSKAIHPTDMPDQVVEHHLDWLLVRHPHGAGPLRTEGTGPLSTKFATWNTFKRQ